MFLFTVEDGTVVVGANSYTTVSYADDYLTANTHVAPVWLALPLATKQALLVWGTRYLDQRASWYGTPTTAPVLDGYADVYGGGVNYVSGFLPVVLPAGLVKQPLRWPRAGASDIDNVPILNNVIPNALQDAVCEMARYLIDDDRSTERAQDGLKMLKVDVVELMFRDGYTLPKVPDQISFIIRGLGTISSGNLGYGKIRRV